MIGQKSDNCSALSCCVANRFVTTITKGKIEGAAPMILGDGRPSPRHFQ